MNEYIKELMHKAGTDCSGKWMNVYHIEKLTKIIIDECIDEMKKNEELPTGFLQARLASTHERTIRERFKIEMD